jgi:uncharacterized protein YkwD
MPRKIDLTGWEEIDETKIPQWVYKRAYKIADKTGRWWGIYLKGKHYRYYIEHLGGQGTIAYRKLRYKYRKEREKKIKKAIIALIILAVAGYFLYPVFQSGEIQSSFQSVGDDIGSWRNESSNYSPAVTSSKSEIYNSPPLISQKPEINIPELEKQIHVLINEEREKRGLSALAWNDKLSIIARKHSQDMANRNYFAHSDPEGHDFCYRYRQEGFNCEVHVGNYIYMGAENIFQNNLYSSVTYYGGSPSYDWNTQEEIAESTVQGWMNSPGHRKNILIAYWKREGIGVAISNDDKVYITEDFC